MFFKSLRCLIFSGANNMDQFWLGFFGQKFYACQGWKFVHEIPLGGSWGDKLKICTPKGKKRAEPAKSGYEGSELETLDNMKKKIRIIGGFLVLFDKNGHWILFLQVKRALVHISSIQ